MDKVSKAKRSEIMAKIHSPTKLELLFFGRLDELSIPYERFPKVNGRPDARVGDTYVFLDGCFWHCCPLHYHRPKTRKKFWIGHVELSNAKRERKRRRLEYRWVRVWEHEITGKRLTEYDFSYLATRSALPSSILNDDV